MQETAHAVAFIEGFTIPQTDFYQIETWNRAIAKAETMFADEAPVNLTLLTKRGKEYLTHTKSGYMAVWPNKAREAGRRCFRVGMSPRYKLALHGCLKAEAEQSGKEYVQREDAGGPYWVDLDKHCCSCEAFAAAKVCFHYVGLAMWLARPYQIQPNGVILFV